MIASLAFDAGFGVFIIGMLVLAGFVISFSRRIK